MILLQMFSWPFMQRALIAGVLVSLCAALLGVSLVLKRYSMIGDGLSHVSFGALAIAVALGMTPLYFSIPVVVLAAFFLLRMASHPHWNSDAAIAVMSASALAIGIIVISRTTGMTTDVTAAQTTTPRKLRNSRMAVRAGKITREEISMAPIIRMPSTMVSAVRTAIRVLYRSTFMPVAREKFSSKVTAKSLW